MAAIPWSLINTFGLPILLWVLRSGISYYRSARASYNTRKHAIRPVPDDAARALNVLFGLALAAVFSTFPYFLPSNIFWETGTRLQTPTDVIYHRLEALRSLTTLDESLRPMLTSREGRLYYFMYGPDVLGNCQMCSSKSPSSYLLYALPSILFPHLVHFAGIGLATSGTLAGPICARWRKWWLYAAGALALADLYAYYSNDIAKNLLSTHVSNIDFFFWRMRTARGLAIAMSSVVLALCLWLSTTNRFFVQPPSVSERLSTVALNLESNNGRFIGAGQLRNTTVRDPRLRNTTSEYWDREADIYEEREVVDAVRVALSHLDMSKLELLASKRVEDIIGSAVP